MDRTKDIIKTINSLSDSKSPYQVFADWIKCVALSLSQCCFKTEKREQQYLETIKEYPAQEFAKMAEMLAETIESCTGDILGNMFMLSGWGNKNTGQFFTPYSVSLAVAQLQSYENNKIVKLNESAAGAGGMIIAVAQAMKEKGINYQKKLRVIAQDCFECAERKYKKAKEYYQKHRDEINERNKQNSRKKYAERKSSGICVKCGKHKAIENKTLCLNCYVKKRKIKDPRWNNEIERTERPQYGLCYVCAKPLTAHHSLCDECLERSRNRMIELNKKPSDKMKECINNFKNYNNIIFKIRSNNMQKRETQCNDMEQGESE